MSINFQHKELEQQPQCASAPYLFEKDEVAPFERLSAFSFEDLTYFTIKGCISHQGTWEGFDEIVLLGGIKDQGMDCALRREGYFKGVIQCKHSINKTRLGKTRFVKELLKFLLYTIEDGDKIKDPEDFTYFIISSSGVTGETINLITNFSEAILRETALRKWTNDIIAQFGTLKALKSYQNIKEKLQELLSKIKVRQLHEKDLAMLLREEHNETVLSYFFKLEKIYVASNIGDNTTDTAISYKKACRFLESASFDFDQIPDHFGSRQDTHVDREETVQLKSWVLSDIPQEKRRIAILEANAGLGKSVVFKDLHKEFKVSNIPVLAIKADKYYAEDRAELARKLFQGDTSFEAVVEAIICKHQKLVILVDQLDALSQTLATNRSFIITYNRLLNDLIAYPEVRIIISVRSFDLNYDAELSHYLKPRYTRFHLGQLQKKEVQRILKIYEIHNYSRQFLDLLCIPNHLNIFCRLQGKTSRNLDLLRNLNDLHEALWYDIMGRAEKQGLRVKPVLYHLAQKMYEYGRITLNTDQHQDSKKEIQFLKSNAILYQDSKGLQFFHQSFYDNVFARYFIDERKDLLFYIAEKGQSLYVRPIIKMLLEFLRDDRHGEYIRYVNSILKSKRYRFHLKVLVLHTLAVTEVPTEQEKECFLKVIHPNYQLLDVFFETSFSRPWMEFILEYGIPEKNLDYKLPLAYQIQNFLTGRLGMVSPAISRPDLKNVRRNSIFRLLVKNLEVHPKLIIQLLKRLEKSMDGVEDFIQRILVQVDNWSEKEWLPLFERYIPFDDEAMKRNPEESNYWYFIILDRMTKSHPDFVIQKLKPVLLDHFDNDLHPGTLEYQQKSIIEKLIETSPSKCFDFLFEIMMTTLENAPAEWKSFLPDSPYYEGLHFRVGGYHKNIPDGDEELYNFIEKLFKINAGKSTAWFSSFYEKHKNTDSIAVLLLIINFFSSYPQKYFQYSFSLLKAIHHNNGFMGYDDNFQYACRLLVGKIFELLDESDQKELAKMVMSVRHPQEYRVGRYKDENYHHLEFSGKKEYLFIGAIPTANLKKHDRLYRRYQELHRKFGKISNDAMDVGYARTYGVGAPFRADAYDKMNFKDWLRSMQKFHDEFRREPGEHPSKGGRDQHAQKFEEVVKDKSEAFYPFIVTLFERQKVSISYLVAGLRGLVEAKYDPKKILELLKKLRQFKLRLVEVLEFIRMARYLISEKCIDQDVFNYLKELALHHEDPTRSYNPDNPLVDSSQTVRSAATIAVVQCMFNKEWEEEIFRVVEHSAKDPFDAVKVGVLSQLAFLNQLNIDRSFSIFLEMTDTDNIQVLKNSMWSADYYLSRFFDELQPFFKKIITHPELHENGMVLITKCWLFYQENSFSEELMERSLLAGDKALAAILHTVEENLFSEDPYHEKCYTMLLKLVNFPSEELSRGFSGLILRKIKPEKFKIMENFLFAYVKSEHIRQEPRYFIELLKGASKNHPGSCITLLEQCIDINNSDIRKSGYLDREPIQAVLAIFSSISKSDEIYNTYKDRVLNLFDALLRNRHYRTRAIMAIDTL